MIRRKDDFEDRRETRRVRGKRSKTRLFLLIGVILFVVFLPKIVTHKAVLEPLVNRLAGVHPLQVQFAGVQAGWFTPISVQGIQVIDEEGQVLAQVREVATGKGVVGWISQSNDLGEITIRGAEATVVASDGSTNLERAFAPWLTTTEDNDATSQSGDSPLPSGTIRLVDSKILLSEAGRPEQWLVEIPQASVTLPGPNQLTGPVELQANIVDVSGTVPDSKGKLAANVKQAAGDAFEVRAKMERVPLDFWHVLHARLPEVPVEQLRGRVSAVLAGNIANQDAWSFVVRDLQAGQLSIVAPTLVGPQPARLQSITGTTTCTLANGFLEIGKTELVCDFASTQATGRLPWPIVTPTASNPFIPGAELQAQGSLDLPKLAAAAETLIPLRENMQLLAGTAQFSVVQTLDERGLAKSSARLQLSDLRALSGDQQMSWQDPLSVELAASQLPTGNYLNAAVAAEFANLSAQGSIQSGELVADVNLSQLRERLSQWVELPITTLEGGAQTNLKWHLEGENTVVAVGNISTTPIRITTSTGNELAETDWAGEFSGRLGLADGTPQSVDQAAFALQSRDEKLVVNLMRPLFLVAATEGTPHPPAAFNIDVHANLANCNRRGSVWLSEPLTVGLDGNLQLAASGLLDLSHVEILSANWNGQPIQVTTPQVSVREPRVVGKFKGRIDSSDLTRTVIETLEMTSSSVSLLAQDQASPDGSGSRVGRARFLADLGRLMNSTTTAVANSQLAANAPDSPAKILASGQCDGELAWQINPQSAGIDLVVNAKNLLVSSQSPGQLSATTLWQEPQATANLSGSWLAESGAVDVQKITLQMPWLQYAGTASYKSTAEGQAAHLEGQANYDSMQLSNKLMPFTGGQLQLSGQQTIPISADWTAPIDASTSTLAGLKAATRFGWEQARVAGILVGKADVPIVVDGGVLRTAAEIPVSDGILRWDLESDLAAEELRLHQKPMMLLENVAITEEMCKGWLKYVTPLLAEATSVDGRMSLYVEQAELSPANPVDQKVKGQLTVHSATVGPGPLSNQIVALVEQVEAIRKQQFTQQVSNRQRVWMNVPEQRIDFEMADGRVIHRNLRVDIGDATILSQGSVGINGELNLVTAMPIPDDWADKSRWLAGFRGQSLQFPMGGTIQHPRLDTQLLSQVGRQAMEQAASGFLQQNLNRGLEKLLGESANQTPESGNATPAENPVLGIGGQILRTPGLNIPGLFGGSREPQTPQQ